MYMQPRKKITWKAFEYTHREKTTDWFWALGIITITMIIVAVLLRNAMFVVVLVLSGFALGVQALKRPKMVDFEITDRGIRIDGKLYPFTSIAAFGHFENDQTRIALRFSKGMRPPLEIPVHEEDYDDIRETLLLHIDEEEYQEPFSQKILAVLGF
jgi:hypothetical protein